MDFTNKFTDEWSNTGTEPSSTLKTNGFAAGYRPPAAIFNWFWSKTMKAITELQTKLSSVDSGKVDKVTGKGLSTKDYTADEKTKLAGIEEGATAVGQKKETNGGEIFNNYGEFGNQASGLYSHAEGYLTNATGSHSHSQGTYTSANGHSAHAEGQSCTASGNYSHAGGYGTWANGFQFVTGKYNIQKDGCTGDNDQSTEHSIFIVGYGTQSTAANALRITAAGKCYGSQSFGAGGADYAEYFEWKDENASNEDRRGRFVTLDGDKIRLASANDDYILGVISAAPSIVGDVQSENWHGMYSKDVFGCPLTETVEVPESTDEQTGKVIPAHTEVRYVVNPDYDDTKAYVSREFRKEWSPVGLLGQLVVVDDGTCTVNGYCKATANGIGTAADSGFRVLKRIDNTHVKVLVK